MKILHIADLHLKKEDCDDCNVKRRDAFRKRLERFINVLKNFKYDVCLLTGDFKYWNNDSWDASLEFVNTLISKVSIKNVIVVPGNHDITSNNIFSFDKRTGNCSIYDKDEKTYLDQVTKQYEQFEKGFIKKINSNGTAIVHPGINHSVVNISGINFVVINSVFAFCAEKVGNNIRKYPFCFNCKSLNKLLQTDEFSINDNSSVAVTHVPFDDSDSCLNRYDYDDGHLCRAKLENKFFCCFAGHEHTNNNDFYKVVGSPGFMDSKFNCAIYDIEQDNNNIISIKTSSVTYDNSQHGEDNFYIGLGDKELKEIFEVSKSSLKPQLFGNDIINNNQDIIKNSMINKKTLKVNGVEYKEADLNTVFSAICELKTLNGERVVSTNKFTTTKSVCNELIKIMEECKFDLKTQNERDKLFVPLTIKGRVGTGKSTFLNILYWEMLLRQKNNFEYIPVMINYSDISIDALQTLIGKIKNLSEIYKKSIYVLIDGLDNCQIYNQDMAEKLWGQIESLKGVDCKFIFCINQHYKSFLEKKADHRNTFKFINNNKTSKYLLYLRPISYVEKVFNYQKLQKGIFGKNISVQGKINEFFKKYIHSYFSLSHYENNEKELALYDFIKCNEILYVDFNLLHLFRINQINRSKKNYDKMNSLYFNSISSDDVQEAARIYLTTNECMEASKFRLLKSYNIINFAFSQYIINKLKVRKNIDSSIIHPTLSSIFPQKYFNTELNGFIKICMTGINNKKEIKENIINAITWAINNNKKLNYVAVAQLIYILRYAEMNPDELDRLMLAIRKNIGNINVKKVLSETRNNYLIALRTLKITEIYHKEDSVYGYLEDLIKSNEKLALNREFSLFYYGDRETLNMNSNEFYKTFSRLYYRIFKHINNDGCTENHSDYIEFDLFTICNIVQINVQKILSVKEDTRGMYLYSTIAMLYDLLRMYCQNKEVSDKNMSIYYYFYSLKNDFGHLLIEYYDTNKLISEQIKEKYTRIHIKSDKEVELLRKLVCIPFEQNNSWEKLLMKFDDITNLMRSGWKDRIKLGDTRCESVAEHSFSVMLISFFISDTHSRLREKLLILSFLHDLAEVYYGDVTPNNSQYSITQECVNASTLALAYLGTYNGYVCWLNYAELIIGYIFPQHQRIVSKDNCIAAQMLNIIDVLQRGLKLFKYGSDMSIEKDRFAEFYKEIKDLDVTMDASLIQLKNFLIAKIDDMKNNIDSK